MQDRYIHVLELRLARLQSQPWSGAQSRSSDVSDLEKHCQALQNHVDEMEVCVSGEKKREGGGGEKEEDCEILE